MEANAKLKEREELLRKYDKENFALSYNSLEIAGMIFITIITTFLILSVVYFCWKHETCRRIQTFLVSPDYQPPPRRSSRRSSFSSTKEGPRLKDENAFGKGAMIFIAEANHRMNWKSCPLTIHCPYSTQQVESNR